MPPLPPPPPAPPPPSFSSGPTLSSSALLTKSSKPVQADRNALLSQIRQGAKLKKTEKINDRSAPLIEGKNESSKASSGNGTVQLGGLFAQGMPKLRSTGSKYSVSNSKPSNLSSPALPATIVSLTTTVDGKKQIDSFTGSDRNGHLLNKLENKINDSKHLLTSQSSKPSNQQPSTTFDIKASLEQKLNFQKNSSFLHKGKDNEVEDRVSSSQKYNTIHVSKMQRNKSNNFSNDVISNNKGPAPSVPTSLNNKAVPPLPSKPPSVQRSKSQSVKTENRSGTLRPNHPSVKPPPPPKSNTVQINGWQQPPLPNKLPTVIRRQSFGENASNVVKSDNNLNTNTYSLSSSLPPPPPPLPVTSNSSINNSNNNIIIKPPPPPRNNSIPNSLSNPNQLPTPISATILSKTQKSNIPASSNSQVSKFHSNSSSPRPPEVPPPPPPHHNINLNHNNASNGNQFNQLNSNTINPSSPSTNPPMPPPSQTRLMPPQPGSKKPSTANNVAPVPPLRNTSISKNDLETRFFSKDIIHLLPAPEPFLRTKKNYASCRKKYPRRPAPHIPSQPPRNLPYLNAHQNSINFMSSSTPMLHVQYDQHRFG